MKTLLYIYIYEKKMGGHLLGPIIEYMTQILLYAI